MAPVRVRLMGGALNGQVLWVDPGQAVLEVHMAKGAEARNTLRYQIEGTTATFVSETGTGTGYVEPAKRKPAPKP